MYTFKSRHFNSVRSLVNVLQFSSLILTFLELSGCDRLQEAKKKKPKKKKRNKKSKGRKANQILGFQYAQPKNPEPEVAKPKFKRKKTSPPREFNKEEFVKASFQFQLLENAKPPGNKDRINWKHVTFAFIGCCK